MNIVTKEDYNRKMKAQTKLKAKQARSKKARLSKGKNRATLVIPDGGTGHPGSWLVKRKSGG